MDATISSLNIKAALNLDKVVCCHVSCAANPSMTILSLGRGQVLFTMARLNLVHFSSGFKSTLWVITIVLHFVIYHLCMRILLINLPAFVYGPAYCKIGGHFEVWREPFNLPDDATATNKFIDEEWDQFVGRCCSHWGLLPWLSLVVTM